MTATPPFFHAQESVHRNVETELEILEVEMDAAATLHFISTVVAPPAPR
jgi:hypothetical protein